VPDDVRRQLAQQSRSIARRNIGLTRELVRLLAVLEQHRIPAIPFKGPALAATLYGDLSLRQFSDLDILVPPEQLERAQSLLRQAGYQPAPGLDGPHQREYRRALHNHHLQMVRANLPVTVELHWLVAAKRFFDAADDPGWWHNLAGIHLAGTPARSFGPQDLLLLLCMHGSKHGWDRLSMVCDVAELLRRQEEANGAALLARAAELRLTRLALLGLALAHTLLDAPLSPAIADAIERDAAARRLADQTLAQLAADPFGERSAPQRVAYRLRLIERWPERLAYGWDVLTAPTVLEWQWVTLPRRLAGLYRLLRPLRLAGKYLWGME